MNFEKQPKIALIMRDDEIIKNFNLKRVTVPTSYGPVHRCYYGEIYNVPVLIIYGRFNGEKSPSNEINHQQTIEVVKNCGISKLIGTFVVGGIKPENEQGTVYIIDDFIGMGNYKIDWDYNSPFRNAEMIQPMCSNLQKRLKEATMNVDFPVVNNAIYVCFNGYPRIETRAELNFYESIGGDCVGQTLDPEATISRLNGICYAALAVQIDSPQARTKYANDIKKDPKANAYSMSISDCRKRTSLIILNFLKKFSNDKCNVCAKLKRVNNNFKEFPKEFYE